MTTYMKGKFVPWMMRERNELTDYLNDKLPPAYSWKYETLVKKTLELNPPKHIMELLAQRHAEYMRPPATLPNQLEKEAIVRLCMDMFPEALEHYEHEFIENGFRIRIRKTYLPDRQGNPISERDVEYRIQASNLQFCRLNKEVKSWGCWVYINRPGHLDAFRYKSLEGTDYGVQWYKC